MEKILNEQINKEAIASQIYLSYSIWSKLNGYDGFADFFYKQSNEEREHMMKIINYMIERDMKPILGNIPVTINETTDIYNCFVNSYKHERYITESIENIVNLSVDNKDWKTFEFMQWFVKEQIEEENNMKNIIDKFNLINRDATGILMLNQQMKNNGSI